MRAIQQRPLIYIDLAGAQGNAFALLGLVGTLGKQLGMEREEINAIQHEMTTGDYRTLLNVFEEHFGEYVEIANYPY